MFFLDTITGSFFSDTNEEHVKKRQQLTTFHCTQTHKIFWINEPTQNIIQLLKDRIRHDILAQHKAAEL